MRGCLACWCVCHCRCRCRCRLAVASPVSAAAHSIPPGATRGWPRVTPPAARRPPRLLSLAFSLSLFPALPLSPLSSRVLSMHLQRARPLWMSAPPARCAACPRPSKATTTPLLLLLLCDVKGRGGGVGRSEGEAAGRTRWASSAHCRLLLGPRAPVALCVCAKLTLRSAGTDRWRLRAPGATDEPPLSPPPPPPPP